MNSQMFELLPAKTYFEQRKDKEKATIKIERIVDVRDYKKAMMGSFHYATKGRNDFALQRCLRTYREK